VLSKKGEILELFENTPELSRLSRNRSIGYIEDYFAILEDEGKLKKLV
jgi:hypothetical protein